MIIEVCDAATTSATATHCNVGTEEEEEEIKKFMSGLDRRFKIRNEYFVKKINKICNSNEYLEALERKHRNKVNEIQLIEYIKDMLEEMVIYLIQFRVRKTEGLSEGEQSKVIYAGLNFLLTREASENYFTLYKQRNDKGDIIEIKSPILELEFTFVPDEIKIPFPKVEVLEMNVFGWITLSKFFERLIIFEPIDSLSLLFPIPRIKFKSISHPLNFGFPSNPRYSKLKGLLVFSFFSE